MTNTLFAVFAVTNREAFKARVASSQSKFTYFYRAVSEDSWFIIAPSTLTTIEFSDAFGITDGSVSGAIVVRAENYYGRASKDIWEWTAAKLGAPLGREV